MRDGRRNSLHKSTQAGAPVLPPEFSSAGAGWDGFVLEHHRHPAFELPPLTSDSYVVASAVGRSFKAELLRDGERLQYNLARGDVSVFPYGFSIDGGTVGACEFILLRLQPTMLERVAAVVAGGGRPRIAPRVGVADPLAAQMLDDVLRELRKGAGQDRAHVEALARGLSAHLVRHYTTAPQTSECQADGMADYVLNAAVEFIEESLERELSPAHVAHAAGLSPSRFARAFKAAKGKTVGRYVDERRVERAKPLLAGGELSPEEVARRVGFASARRFAAVFRSLTGVSPRLYAQQAQP